MLRTLCYAMLAMFLLLPGAFADDNAQEPKERGFKAAIKRAARKAKEAAKKAAAAAKKATKKAVAKTKAAASKAKAAMKKAAAKTKAAVKKAAAKTKEAAKKAAAKTKVAAQKAKVAVKQAAAKTKAAVKKAVDKVKAKLRREPPPPAAVASPKVVPVPAVSGEVTTVAQPKAVLQAPKGSVFASILKSGQVRVCVRTDTPPFGYFVGQSLRGFDITLAKKLVAGIGIRYGQTLKVQWNVINAKARIPSLEQGRCDMVIAAFSKTAARAKKVAFSKVYLSTYKVLIANKNITRQRPILAVVSGATSVTNIVPGAQVTEFFNYTEILNAMKRGYVDYVLSDHPTAGYLVHRSKGFKVQQVLNQQEKYAIGLHKHHTYLLQEVNAVLGYLARSGHLAHFHRQWIK